MHYVKGGRRAEKKKDFRLFAQLKLLDHPNFSRLIMFLFTNDDERAAEGDFRRSGVLDCNVTSS